MLSYSQDKLKKRLTFIYKVSVIEFVSKEKNITSKDIQNTNVKVVQSVQRL